MGELGDGVRELRILIVLELSASGFHHPQNLPKRYGTA